MRPSRQSSPLMRNPLRILVLLSVFSLRALAAEAAPDAATAPLPRDWIDPQTGHRIIRISPDTGAGTLYFTQHSFTPEGDKIVLRGRDGIMVVDLKTLGTTPTKSELVLPNQGAISMSWKTRDAYYVDRSSGALMAVNVG